MTVRPRRSVLYMPGANVRALEKAKSLPADALILDLEDAVAPDAKAQARTQVTDAVKAGGYGTREIVIRINGLDSPWGRRSGTGCGPYTQSRKQRRHRARVVCHASGRRRREYAALGHDRDAHRHSEST